MANPTKVSLEDALKNAFDSVTSNTGQLTDQECTDCYNAMLSAVETLDPVKGTPTVKY